MDRRSFIIGSASLSALSLAGCSTSTGTLSYRSYASMYGPLPKERFPIPAVNLSRVPDKFYRREVAYSGSERPGTLVVDTQTFHLYLVGDYNRAMRYGVGLGRAGFGWSGRANIAFKRKWPTWTPPPAMIRRQPELARWGAANGGMPPGLTNPLGARALYVFRGGVDTLYRIHGSPEYWSIGQAVSSGCVRMMNQDVIDLYERVTPGARIVVT